MRRHRSSRIPTILVHLGLAGVLFLVGCSETRNPARDASSVEDGAGGQPGTDAATCEPTLHVLLYVTPGCGGQAPEKQCVGNNTCVMWACSCAGKVLYGCNGFAEPFAYGAGFQGTSMPDVGSACDPSAADGGAD